MRLTKIWGEKNDFFYIVGALNSIQNLLHVVYLIGLYRFFYSFSIEFILDIELFSQLFPLGSFCGEHEFYAFLVNIQMNWKKAVQKPPFF